MALDFRRIQHFLREIHRLILLVVYFARSHQITTCRFAPVQLVVQPAVPTARPAVQSAAQPPQKKTTKQQLKPVNESQKGERAHSERAKTAGGWDDRKPNAPTRCENKPAASLLDTSPEKQLAGSRSIKRSTRGFLAPRRVRRGTPRGQDLPNCLAGCLA